MNITKGIEAHRAAVEAKDALSNAAHSLAAVAVAAREAGAGEEDSAAIGAAAALLAEVDGRWTDSLLAMEREIVDAYDDRMRDIGLAD